MKKYNTLLVAIDLYGEPEQVLTKAWAIAEENQAQIHILTAVHDPSYVYASYAKIDGALKNTTLSAKQKTKIKALEKIHSLIKPELLSNTSIIVEFGRATDVIIEQAKQLQADLIIIGSHGKHGLRLILGSTAIGVLHQAKCDVLAVRMRAAKG